MIHYHISVGVLTIIPTDKDDTSDPPITDDPISDRELRQVIATTGSYKDAICELLKALGVRGRHTRIIDGLAILGTDSKIIDSHLTEGVNLGLIRAYASQFRGEYDSDQPTRAEIEESLKSEKDMDRLKELKEKLDKLKRKRSNRVSRDLCAFRDALEKAGAVYRIKDVGFFGFLDYWQGAPEFKDREAIPGRYRLHFLRFVALVLQRQKEITAKTGRDGLTQAANEIAAEILAWVAIRKTALGDQPQTETENEPPAKDPLKVAEQKRQALIRAFDNYVPFVGIENAEEVFETLKSEALLVTDNKEMSPQNERLHLADIEAERAFLRIAEHFRHSWQAQGCTRVGQIKSRLWPLLLTFLNTLLTGSSSSSIKREKIKGFALKMAKSVLDTADSLMSNINVGHGEPETGADSDQIFGSEPDGDGMNIVVEIGPEPFDTDPVVIDDLPEETAPIVEAVPLDTSQPEVIEFPAEAKGPQRERMTDYGYRGAVIWAASDGDFSGRIVSHAGEAGGMHYLNFEALDASGHNGAVPLDSLYYPDERFKPDADLCDLWRKLRLGGAA